MQHLNPFISPDIAAKVDEIMANARARFGHDAFRMEDGEAGDGGSADDAGSSDDGGDGLGDAGKQAIDRMKAERNAERKRAATAEAELEKLRNADKSEFEKAIDAARKEGEAGATAKSNARLVRAETKALAAGAKFIDSAEAIALLGDKLSTITVDEDGEVDQAALKALVDDLAKTKPHLIASGTTTATAADAGIGTTGTKKPSDPGSGRSRIRAAIEAGSK